MSAYARQGPDAPKIAERTKAALMAQIGVRRFEIAKTHAGDYCGRKNCSGAFFGTLKGVADFWSRLNLANVAGFF